MPLKPNPPPQPPPPRDEEKPPSRAWFFLMPLVAFGFAVIGVAGVLSIGPGRGQGVRKITPEPPPSATPAPSSRPCGSPGAKPADYQPTDDLLVSQLVALNTDVARQTSRLAAMQAPTVRADMRSTGGGTVAVRTAELARLERVCRVAQGELVRWALEDGFTAPECWRLAEEPGGDPTLLWRAEP